MLDSVNARDVHDGAARLSDQSVWVCTEPGADQIRLFRVSVMRKRWKGVGGMTFSMQHSQWQGHFGKRALNDRQADARYRLQSQSMHDDVCLCSANG